MGATEYYKILGVDKKAGAAEIKKAYRKKAMKYHPDHTKGDKAAEDKFKKISEAYAVLSDPEKRKQYDTYGSADFQQRYSEEDIFRNFDINEILREFGFGGGFGGGGRSARFNFGGNGFGRQASVKGQDLVYEAALSLVDVINGVDKSIHYTHEGRTVHLSVKIPKGFITGKKLRVKGKGGQSPYDGPAGDLLVKSKVVPHPHFTIEGHDLTTTQSIKLSEALLGTSVTIEMPDGNSRRLKVPAGARHQTRMRIAGAGLPYMHQSRWGDLYVRILVDIPKTLSREQQRLVAQLAQTGL